MADATKTITTSDPTADLELNETKPGAFDPDSSNALDQALLDAGYKADGTAIDPADIKPKGDDNTPKPDDNTPKPDSNTPPAAGVVTPPPLKDDNTPKPDDNTPAPAPGAKDDLDSIELPPHTKPKTAESFANVKNLARQKIAAIEKEREELKAKLTAAEEAAKKAPTPEETKELEELRKFRRSVDVEADPKFKEYDSTVTRNVESIYSKLEASGFPKETIAKIKEMGGPDQINWDDLHSKGKVSTTLKRYIEGKLFENEDLGEKKKGAIAEAKKNADEYLKTREADFNKSDDKYVKETATEWDKEIRPKVDWLVIQKIDEKLKPEEKELATEHNKLVERVEGDIKEALQDNSPRMKALLVAGYAVGQKMSWEFARLKKATDTQIAALNKELGEAKTMLERIKRSSPGRANSAAPSTAPTKKVTASSHVAVEDRGAHLDNLLAEAQAAQAAKEV